MQGKRTELIQQEGGFQLLNPGEYGQWKDGNWYGTTPNGHCANLSRHTVTEHGDGTISVTPSILVSDEQVGQLWHGYLTKGIWNEC